MFSGLDFLIRYAIIISIVFIPLGVWKFIELLIWFFSHIHFS